VIPELVDIGGPWNVLPPGIHDASLDEVNQRYATTPHRKRLFEGLERAVADLREAGCASIFLDGSFVTDKPTPGDFDVCWDPAGVDEQKVPEVFFDFSEKRKAQKQQYGGEFFLVAGFFLGFFQNDQFVDKPKGIIRIH
jgi:hypothetical protein